MVQNDAIKQLHKIISALEQFQTQKGKLFSLDKLAIYLNLTEKELQEILGIVFRFQALFSSMFKDFVFVKKSKNGKSYLILKPKNEVNNIGALEPKEIEINKDQAELLTDIVYYFQHVKIGKEFNVKSNGAELSKKIKLLRRSHPYFFKRKGNGLVYPSKLAVEAGNLIRSYNKSKKSLSKLEIEDYLIQIV